MPEIHINGRPSSHNSSLKIDDLGTTQDTSSGLFVTEDSYNSTIAINTPTNTMDQHTSLCETVSLIMYFCLIVLAIMIATVFYLAKKRQRPKTQRKHGTKPSFQMELLSPPNAIQI